MARDLRQIGFNRNNYPDRCYFYDSKAVQGGKLVEDATPLGRFYKRDLKAFQWERPTVNGIVSNRLQFQGIVETADHVESLRPDMFVVDQTGMLFIVVAPVVSDDANKSKVVGTRPTIVTQFTLRGIEIR